MMSGPHLERCLPKEVILDCCAKLSSELQEFYGLYAVPEVEGSPTPLQFARSWLSLNKPVIFRNAVKHWPAVKKWTYSYLRSVMGMMEVTVAVTPNGYADAIDSGFFVMPEERKIPFGDFLDILENRTSSNAVYYIQKQNSNMTEEMKHLINDVDSEIHWASAAIGKAPDAVNFWMGDKQAVTSMHRDHYENIYCVIKGQKEFILLPPTDLPWVPYDTYPTAVYKETNGHFEIVETGDKVLWISVDPLNPSLEKFPLYKKASPIHCVVNEGDAMYLPSLWFHHVRQSHGCIAVNYWYDMEYDIKYCYYKFLESLLPLCTKAEDDNKMLCTCCKQNVCCCKILKSQEKKLAM